MKRRAYLSLVVVGVLLAAYTLRRSPTPAPVSGGEVPQPVKVGSVVAPVEQILRQDGLPKLNDPESSRPGTTTVPGSTPRKSTVVRPMPTDLDPFALLDKQHETAITQLTPQFDAAEKTIKARVQPALDTSYAKYKLDMAALEQSGLDANEKRRRNEQLNAQYQKAWLDIKAKVQPDLDELDAKRKEALTKLELDRTEKRIRLQTIRTMAEKDQIDPIAAKQAQLHILGISLPLSSFQLPEAEEESLAQTEADPPKDQTPTVEAVITAADNRFCALIGDALVYEGNMVKGYRVRKICADSVDFEKDGKVWVQKVD